MLLTSTSLQILTVGLAVASTVAALLLWNRVRGPRAVRVASRFGLLAGGYLATAAAVLISVNIAYGGLIVSWSDLFSNINPPMVPHMRHPGAGQGGGYGFGWDGPDRVRPAAGTTATAEATAAGVKAGSGATAPAATATAGRTGTGTGTIPVPGGHAAKAMSEGGR